MCGSDPVEVRVRLALLCCCNNSVLDKGAAPSPSDRLETDVVHAGPIDKAGDSDVIVLDGGARRHFKVVQGQKEVEDNILQSRWEDTTLKVDPEEACGVLEGQTLPLFSAIPVKKKKPLKMTRSTYDWCRKLQLAITCSI